MTTTSTDLARSPNGSATLDRPEIRSIASQAWASVLGLALVGCAIWIIGCSNRGTLSCDDGRYCACSDGAQCFIGCHADRCNLDCGHTGDACGTVCGDDCVAACHDTPNCSHSCGDHCQLDCHSVVSCGAHCGSYCTYSCHNLQTCGVRVGPYSTVDCSTASSCTIECEGPCNVVCSNVQSCSVACLATRTTATSGNGTYHCP